MSREDNEMRAAVEKLLRVAEAVQRLDPALLREIVDQLENEVRELEEKSVKLINDS